MYDQDRDKTCARGPPAHIGSMTARTPGSSPYATTLEALEGSAHVARDDQVETCVPPQGVDSSGTWDEERRQAMLAGGA